MRPVTVAGEPVDQGEKRPVIRFLVGTQDVLTGRPYYNSVGRNVKFMMVVFIIERPGLITSSLKRPPIVRVFLGPITCQSPLTSVKIGQGCPPGPRRPTGFMIRWFGLVDRAQHTGAEYRPASDPFSLDNQKTKAVDH